MPIKTDDDLFEDDPATCSPVVDEATGEVRLLSERCPTCIFRRGNPFHSAMPHRIRSMIADAVENEGHVVCHSTLPGSAPADTEPAICRGFADGYGDRSLAIRLGNALALIREIPPPR